MSARLTVVGDALLDCDVTGDAERLCPDAAAPVVDERDRAVRPGGAGLAAAIAAAAGHRVRLVCALGDDEAATRLREALSHAGVEVIAVPAVGETRQKTRVRVAGHSLVRLDRGTAVPSGLVSGTTLEAVADAVADAQGVLVADYGAGTAALAPLRRLLQRSIAERPLVWDPHPNGPLPLPGSTLITPNEREALAAAQRREHRRHGRELPAATDRVGRAAAVAEELCLRWRAHGVSVTLGELGAVLSTGAGSPLVAPAPPVTATDACGAGDAYAVSATAALAGGAVLSEAVLAGVATAAAFVAGAVPSGRAGATRPITPAPDADGAVPMGDGATDGDGHPAVALAQRVRAAGGTVVVAGGCFDLLHRGHVEVLAAARRLGDCLIVALNSDASIRTLKGPGRPIVTAEERAAVLGALRSVDGVLVFDEATPARALRQLRPHLFVKGGDYAGLAIEERGVLAAWGGRVVTVPYLPDHSTTNLVNVVRRG